MSVRLRTVLAAVTAAALVVVVPMGLPGLLMAAFAGETANALNSTSLVKFDDRDYEVTYEPSVSNDPLSSATVRKIGYGKTRFVSIATTSTGTYSSEGLVSPHFRYPGVHVRPVPETSSRSFVFSTWSRGRGWTAISVRNGQSFVSVGTKSTYLRMKSR